MEKIGDEIATMAANANVVNNHLQTSFTNSKKERAAQRTGTEALWIWATSSTSSTPPVTPDIELHEQQKHVTVR